VVVVGHERKLGSRVVGDHRVQQMPPIRVVVGQRRSTHIVLSHAELAVRGPCQTHAQGFAGVDGNDVVPAVDQISGDRKLGVEGVLGAGAEVVVGNGKRKEQAAGIVPVVL